MTVNETDPSARGASWGSWLRVVVAGLAAAFLLRACAIEAYRIPSNSMEGTLLVGDFVLVSKLAYGPRIGETRLPGLGRVRCGDVVVFNHPPARGAITDRPPYIKRVLALPGQRVELAAGVAYVDGQRIAPPSTSLARYDLTVADSFVPEASGVAGQAQRAGRNRWIVSATPAAGATLAEQPGVVEAVPFVASSGGGAAFPRSRRWGMDDWGPLTVPRAGWTVLLSDETVGAYRSTLERHEGRRLERVPGGWHLDGVPADSVTFQQNYLFVLGDNRGDSADSRTWGFVPMSHVIGRAEAVYFSADPPAAPPGASTDTPSTIRWDRIGTRVARSCAASARP